MLKELRKAKGLSRSELSKASGVSIKMIEQYEQGIRSINKAQAQTVYYLSLALSCKMEDLIDKDEEHISKSV